MPGLLDALTGDDEVARLFSDEAEIRALLDVEAALAAAESEVGLITSEAADRIGQTCVKFSPDRNALREGIARDGVVIPALVRQLRGAVGETYQGMVHLGATSQDIVDTALTLRLQRVFDILDKRLAALIGQLDRWSEEEGGLPLMAHTRMQQALPFSVRDKLATWSEPLRRNRERLAVIRRSALVIQLGGPVGNGDSFQGQAQGIMESMAKRLGLGRAGPWHSDRDRIMDMGHLFALLSGSLGKMGQDIALMAQNEVAEVRLAGGGSSSAMAHKRNPIAAEVLVALARLNAGLNGTLQQSLVHESERSGAAWTLEWLVLPQMAIAAGASLRHGSDIIEGASFARPA